MIFSLLYVIHLLLWTYIYFKNEITGIIDLSQEQKIMQLNEEVGRLRDVEMESFRKDAYIQTLQQLVNDLKTKFAEQQPLIMGQDVNLTQKICQLENEVTSKEQELSAVKEQVTIKELVTLNVQNKIA